MTASAAPTTLASAARDVSTEEATGILRSEYGMEAGATRLIGERDQNFAVRTHAGAAYVLKVIHPAEPPAVTDFQSAILLEIARRNPALPVQRIVPTLGGAGEARVALADGTRRAARLTSFMPGIVASAAPQSLMLSRRKGELLARTQLALAGFAHPADRHEIDWDLAHTPRQRAVLPEIGDPHRRALMEAALERFERRVLPVQPSFRRQVVHNDLSPDNLVLDPGDLDAIAGLIDFGDAADTACVHDLAIALAYDLRDTDDPIEGSLPLVRGFAAVKPLLDDEVEHLLDLVIARQVIRVGISEWRARRFPENRAYILRRTPAAWRSLEALMRLPADTVTETFRKASRAA